jgi:hypothetical protein
MSKKGLETAIKYGEKLDSFEDAAQAEQYFFSYRDEAEAAFIDLSKEGKEFFTADYSADSLKGLMSMNSQRMFVGLDSMPGNKRRNFMSRTYKQYTDF